MKLKPWEIKAIKFTNPQDLQQPSKIKQVASKYSVLIRLPHEDVHLSQ